MKKFSEIVEILKENELLVEAKDQELDVEDISYDSRNVKENTLFFCKGVHFDVKYLEDAINRGTGAYISENKYDYDMPYIIVNDIRKAMYVVAGFFFDYPDRKLNLIGVTATKGKTTTVTLIKESLDLYAKEHGEKPAGLISTTYTYDGVNEYESHLSTPEAIELHRNLYNAYDSGLKYVVLEVSSQSLKYDRVAGLDFDIAGIVTIGRDHIAPNEHPTVEDYVDSKLKLADLAKKVVYCRDTDHLERIENKLKGMNATSFAAEHDADFKITNLRFEDGFTKFTFDGDDFELNMMGKFNSVNAACALLVLKHFGIDYKYAKEVFKNIVIPGRSNLLISNDGKKTIFVDYAHNELSFTKNFEMLKKYFPDYKIVTLFSARGSKAFNRRKESAIVVSNNSDYIYLIPIEPNYEELSDIYASLIKNFTWDIPYEEFETRVDGLEKAFKTFGEKTILFIAGKGDERYQSIKGEYIEIESDLQAATRLINAYNETHPKE